MSYCNVWNQTASKCIQTVTSGWTRRYQLQHRIILHIEDLQKLSCFEADLRFKVTIVLYTKFLTSFQDLRPKIFSSVMHFMQSFFPGTWRAAINFAKCLCTALLSASFHGLLIFISTNDREDNLHWVIFNTQTLV